MMLPEDRPLIQYDLCIYIVTWKRMSHQGRGGAQSDVSMNQRALVKYNDHLTGIGFFFGGTNSVDILTPGSAYIL